MFKLMGKKIIPILRSAPMPDTYYDSAIDSIYQDQENCLKQFFSGYPYRIRFEIF